MAGSTVTVETKLGQGCFFGHLSPVVTLNAGQTCQLAGEAL
jgi:hypothetical protein